MFMQLNIVPRPSSALYCARGKMVLGTRRTLALICEVVYERTTPSPSRLNTCQYPALLCVWLCTLPGRPRTRTCVAAGAATSAIAECDAGNSCAQTDRRFPAPAHGMVLPTARFSVGIHSRGIKVGRAART